MIELGIRQMIHAARNSAPPTAVCIGYSSSHESIWSVRVLIQASAEPNDRDPSSFVAISAAAATAALANSTNAVLIGVGSAARRPGRPSPWRWCPNRCECELGALSAETGRGTTHANRTRPSGSGSVSTHTVNRRRSSARGGSGHEAQPSRTFTRYSRGTVYP